MQKHPFNAKTYSDDWDEPQPVPATPTGASRPPANVDEPPARIAAPAKAPDAPEQLVASEPTRKERIPAASQLDRYPAFAARSSLFRVGHPKGAAMAAEELSCYEKEMRIIYSGPMLSMDDKRVWEVALAEAKVLGHAGEEFNLSANRIAKALGKTSNGSTTASIGQCLARLAAATIEYQLPEGGAGMARLLGSAAKGSAGWRVSIDLGLLPSLTEHKQFRRDADRRRLFLSSLAQWMHDFMATHKKEYQGKFTLGDLASLCGASSDPSHFPAMLRVALSELAAGCPEIVKTFEITRVRRDWRTWLATITKGDEVAHFTWPAEDDRKKRARQAKAKSAGAPAKRRGGVEL